MEASDEDAKVFSEPDETESNPDPTMKPKGGHPGESVKPPFGGEDIAPDHGRSPAVSQEQTKKNGGTQTK